MSSRVCLYASTITYPVAGGQFWVYLNWALGLRALGCEVTWLEDPGELPAGQDSREAAALLEQRVARHLPGATVALAQGDGLAAAAADADLLLNFSYDCRETVVGRFRRAALVDIDPGLTQVWMTNGDLEIANHDVYFTTGETVGRRGSRIPSGGLDWQYTPPAVHLPSWPRQPAIAGAAYTTVTHWWGEWEIVGDQDVDNSKRLTFLEYAPLPERVEAPLELALTLIADDARDRALLERRGWLVRPAEQVSSTPEAYRSYIQRSRGEFSCAKPSCMLLENAWVSDRTLCYLASGKPAIVQHTGPSRILPQAEGLFRFRTLQEAARALRAAESDYARHCAAARAIAEEHFDARKVVASVLERAL